MKTASVLLDDTAPSLLPAWCLLGLSSLLRTPERSLSTLEACGGPLGPPSLRFLHFQSPGWFLAETPARTATEFDCSNLCSDKDSDDSSWCVGYEYIPVTPGAGTRRFTSTCRLFDDCTKVKEEAAAVKEAEAQAEKIRAEKEEEERLEAEARARAEKAEKERKEAAMAKRLGGSSSSSKGLSMAANIENGMAKNAAALPPVPTAKPRRAARLATKKD